MHGNYSFLSRRLTRIEKCSNNEIFLFVVFGGCLAYTLLLVFCLYLRKHSVNVQSSESAENTSVLDKCQEATDSISRLQIAPERELLRDFEYKNIFGPIKTSTSI